MGSHGNALAVSFFRGRARLRSRAYDFHYSIEKRCGKLGHYVSFNEIHVLYWKFSIIEQSVTILVLTPFLKLMAIATKAINLGANKVAQKQS